MEQEKKAPKFKRYHIVIIEWDGEQPPTRWYDRMHALAGRVRGDKEMSVAERRTDKALIVQEGAILCASESLATQLALYAREEFGARHVLRGTTQLSDTFGFTREDRQIMRRVENVLGARGRPPRERLWAITCREEMAEYEVEAARPLQCPKCKGLHIHTRGGSLTGWEIDPGAYVGGRGVMAAWQNTRFYYSTWEPAPVRVKGERDIIAAGAEPRHWREVDLNRVETPFGRQENEALEAMAASDELVDVVGRMKLADAITLLDAVYVNRRYVDPAKRQRARVEAAQAFFAAGGSPMDINLAEMPTPDLLSASGQITPEIVAQYLFEYVASDRPDAG